ncbi:MAG TPA: type II secretion system F family protein [Propionicimonas sp.]|nr:type II secretion system F family protein [Propionicimonas sp.]HQA78081.1 type II secretion system F family protein [Propionicimonas sp.]HQD96902.1 type II secretion system F family protein [Propionicimonas sp.]
MTAIAVLAAFLAGWVGFAPSAVTRLRPVEGGAAWSPSSQRRLGAAFPLVVVAVASIIGLMVWGGAGGSVAFAVTLPLVTAWTVWRRHRRRSTAAATARDVATACQQLAGLLRVGHVPGVALRLAAQDAPVLADAAAIHAIGGEVAAALRRQSAVGGYGGLAQLGIAWDVAERTGASLTATLDALAERLAADRAVHNVVAAELSGPRATGRLLAVLPLVGLGLGYGFGGDPLEFLTASVPGQLCLALGALLGCVGVFWTERIAGSEEDLS